MSDADDRVQQFTEFRQRMNQRILDEPNQVIRRFFALDTQTYQPGALDVKTKELCGLVASMVLRCDDCISYHVAQCKEAGVTRAEMFEAISVGLVVGVPSSFRTCAAPPIFSTDWNTAKPRRLRYTTMVEGPVTYAGARHLP